MGASGVLYYHMVVAGLDVADRMRWIRPAMQAAMVGGVVGLLAFFAPHAIGSGESQVPCWTGATRSPRLESCLWCASSLGPCATRRDYRAACSRHCSSSAPPQDWYSA